MQFKVHSLIVIHDGEKCLCASHSTFHVFGIFYTSLFVLRANSWTILKFHKYLVHVEQELWLTSEEALSYLCRG